MRVASTGGGGLACKRDRSSSSSTSTTSCASSGTSRTHRAPSFSSRDRCLLITACQRRSLPPSRAFTAATASCHSEQLGRRSGLARDPVAVEAPAAELGVVRLNLDEAPAAELGVVRFNLDEAPAAELGVVRCGGRAGPIGESARRGVPADVARRLTLRHSAGAERVLDAEETRRGRPWEGKLATLDVARNRPGVTSRPVEVVMERSLQRTPEDEDGADVATALSVDVAPPLDGVE